MLNLNLASNQIRTLSGAHLTLTQTQQLGGASLGIACLVNLEELNISNNQLLSLDGLQSLAKLRVLDASSNLISSVTEVARLNMNINLRSLHLKGNPIANKR